MIVVLFLAAVVLYMLYRVVSIAFASSPAGVYLHLTGEFQRLEGWPLGFIKTFLGLGYLGCLTAVAALLLYKFGA